MAFSGGPMLAGYSAPRLALGWAAPEPAGTLPSPAPAAQAAHSNRVGCGPYGSRVGAGGQLVENPAEADAVALARRHRWEGQSLRQIAAGLVAEGIRPRGQGLWAIQTIRRLVTG